MNKNKKVKIITGLFLLSLFSFPVKAAEGELTVPWSWYLSRSSALLAFFLLYISVFLGLAIRLPFLKKIIAPFYSCQFHCWLAVQSLFWAFFHGITLLFDKYFNFGLIDVFVPFAARKEIINQGINNFILALGIVGFYLMLILVVTSYQQKRINHSLWRAVHFLNIPLYFFIVTHALFLGTDLKDGWGRIIFIGLNIILTILFLINLFYQFIKKEKLNSCASTSE